MMTDPSKKKTTTLQIVHYTGVVKAKGKGKEKKKK